MYQTLQSRHIVILISNIFHISQNILFSHFCNPVALALVASPYFMTTDTFYWGQPAAAQEALAGTQRIQSVVILKSDGEKYD